MRTYKSYHTCIKQLARANALPQKYSSSIDRSTIWRWKQENKDKYLGHELSNIHNLQQFLEWRESEALIRAYLKITLALSSIFQTSNHLHSYLKQNKEVVVKTMIRYGMKINQSLIFRILRLSSSTFHHWKNLGLFPCNSSVLKKCRKIYPNQLTEQETTRLKALLMDTSFKYWPISSIAHYARRNNILHVSLSTWYNYISKLGIKHHVPKAKPKYRMGIRAKLPHQIWHADITIVKCLNGMKYYVYLLMDNYSRFILNYQVATRVSAKIRLDSIKKAYREYTHDPQADTMLLMDGGPENNNHLVDQYVNSKHVSL